MSPTQLATAKGVLDLDILKRNAVESDLEIQVGAKDTKHQLGFCQIDGAWHLAVRSISGKNSVTEKPQPLVTAPYWVRIKAANKLDELVYAFKELARCLNFSIVAMLD